MHIHISCANIQLKEKLHKEEIYMEKILVVVDMQKDFIDGKLGSKEAMYIVDEVAKKIESYIEHDERIYFTKDTHSPEYLSTQEGINLPVEHCVKNTDGWEFPEKINSLFKEIETKSKESILFEKGQFGSIELAQILKNQISDMENTEIEIIGLCTDICVIVNAMLIKTYLPEVKLIVDSKCCAGVTPESHINALNAMKMCQIKVV